MVGSNDTISMLFRTAVYLQAVVAFDPPTDVTCYIQARGRARKCNSHYCWMAPQSVEADVKKAVSTKLLKMQQ